jgi:hypothetical protein
MIQIIRRTKHNKRLDIDNGELQKPLKQVCKNCNCKISVSNLFDLYIKKNCYADPLYMIDPYELAFKCPNCDYQITLSSLNNEKVEKFLKRHNTDIYDLRDYLEYVKWFKCHKYVEPKLIKDNHTLGQLAEKLYKLVYLMEIFHYPEFTCKDVMNYYLIKEMRNFYKHKQIHDIQSTKKLLKNMSFDYLKEKYKNQKEYENE